MERENCLILSNVTRKYIGGSGISDINLQLTGGNVYALIGPNGAGKSTLMRTICGLERPDKGSVSLNMTPTLTRSAKKMLGYAADESILPLNMSVTECIHVIADIKYSVLNADTCEQMLKDFGLWTYRNKLLASCSSGTVKKVMLLTAFLEFPSLILLDEPTNAVDTAGLIVLKKYISAAKSKGCIVLVSGHVLDFLSTVCDKAIFIKDGLIVKCMESSAALEAEYIKIYDI